MLRSPARLMLPALLLLPIPAPGRPAGGWAVVTVEDLPDYVVAGRPVGLTFTVRQHGVSRLEGLRPSVEARAGERTVRVAAIPIRTTGLYTATLNLPEPGEWTITIHSGFMDNDVTLLPLPAVGRDARVLPVLAERERGRRLFVAKGCASCHVHRGAQVARTIKVGPELSDTRLPADYLAKFLADPSIRPPSGPNRERMPNLGLEQPEIASLVAFLNAPTAVSTR